MDHRSKWGDELERAIFTAKFPWGWCAFSLFFVYLCLILITWGIEIFRGITQ